MTFRVVVAGTCLNGFVYQIEQVDEREGVTRPMADITYIIQGTSVEQLREILQAMLAACDRPPLYLPKPELKEWQG
jgi:hypothetical protein